MTLRRAKQDVVHNRAAQKWSRTELLRRLIWDIASPIFFRASPRQFWVWRRILLRCFGAKIGERVQIHPSVRIIIPWTILIGDDVGVGDRAILYGLGSIVLGPRVTISQNAHICAGSHDHRSENMELIKSEIVVRKDAWVCADSFVGPGVTIGERAVVGARGVVMRDVESDTVVAGNPARIVSSHEYIK